MPSAAKNIAFSASFGGAGGGAEVWLAKTGVARLAMMITVKMRLNILLFIE
jgi:hypothetical protein